MIESTLPAGLTLAQPANATGNQDLNQASFLKLMTAQLKFQDPFDPVDNTDMVAQMAQFSSVAGIAEMNSSLKAIAEAFNGSRLSQASQMIGRSVLAQGDVAAMGADGLYRGQVTLSAPSDALTIELIDGDGKVVHAMTGPAPEGAVPFSFAHLDENGQPRNVGPLTVRVSGGVASSVSTWLPVSAVGMSAAGADAMLTTPVGPVELSAVRGVG